MALICEGLKASIYDASAERRVLCLSFDEVLQATEHLIQAGFDVLRVDCNQRAPEHERAEAGGIVVEAAKWSIA